MTIKSNDLWDLAKGIAPTSSPSTRRRASVHGASDADVEKARRVLKLPAQDRTRDDVRLLWEFCSKTIAFMSRLTDEQGLSLCSHMKFEKMYPHDILFRQNQVGDAFYIVLFGKVDVYMIQSSSSSGGSVGKSPGSTQRRMHEMEISSAWKQARSALELSAIALHQFMTRNIPESADDATSQMYKQLTVDACRKVEEWASECENLFSSSRRREKIRTSEIARTAVVLCRTLRELRVSDSAVEIMPKACIFHSDTSEAHWNELVAMVIKCVQATCYMIPLVAQSALNELGKLITTLGPGTGFGELALMSETSKRNASIVASGDTQLTEIAVIDRDMYNAALKNMHTDTLEAKLEFLASLPYFINWKKNHLTKMAYTMTERKFNLNQIIVNAGEICSSIFFIVSGEVKLTKPLVQEPSESRPASRPNRVSFKARRASNVAVARSPRRRNSATAGKMHADIGIVVAGDVLGHDTICDEIKRHDLTAVAGGMVVALEISKSDAERWLKANAVCVSALRKSRKGIRGSRIVG